MKKTSRAFNIVDADLRTQVALFRHGLVGALTDLEHGQLKANLKAIAQRQHTFPSGRRGRVSFSALKRWLKAFRVGGLEALKPALRKDYGTSRAIPEEWLNKAIALRQELHSRTALVLVEILALQPGCPKICPHTLDRLLLKKGMTRRLLSKTSRRFKRWVARHVNDLWQGDATPGIWLPHPRDPKKKVRTVLFLWIDDVSRLIVHAEFFFDEKLPRMERTLRIALSRRGRPRRLYTDNGNVFRALQFKAAMAELGIKSRHSKVGRPQGRGKVERIFGVLQKHFYPEVYLAKITTLTDLNHALQAWIERIYHNRKHKELKATPLAVYQAGEEHIHPVDPVKMARAFLWRYERRVSSNGFVSLFGNSYSVDPTWSGQTIELRLDPFDFSRIDVYRDQRPIASAQVRHLKRASFLDIQPLQPAATPSEPSGISFLDSLRREHNAQLARELGPIPMHLIV